LLDDPKLYLNVFGEMRKLLEQESNMNHPVYGYAIFGVLKTMAVVDLVGLKKQSGSDFLF
jgi:hypothetical protein